MTTPATQRSGSSPAAQPGAALVEQTAPPPIAADRPSRWSLGRLLPLTLVVWAVLDVLPRFGPLEWLELDPVQIAQRAPERYGPFKANLRLQAPYAGTEGRLANVRPEEFREPVVFTTDSLGFRLSPFAAEEQAAALVFGGFSFTFGSALSDDETFPSVLGSMLGVRTYNAGRFQGDPETAEEMDWLLNRLGGTVRTAVYVYADAAPTKPVGRPTAPTEAESLYAYAKRYVRGWRMMSPIEILSVRFHKALTAGDLLPNELDYKVVPTHLPNGDRVLLWRNEIEAWDAPDLASAGGQAEFIAWWRDELKRRNIEMSVLLLPSKTEVYGPMLLGRSSVVKESFLNVFETELQRREIPVLNALTELRASAARDISQGTLSFYREDSHWNPEGVSRLASAVAAFLRENGWQAPPSKITSTSNRANAR